MATQTETISLRLSTKTGVACPGAREIAVVDAVVCSDKNGAYANVGPFQIPYRPCLSSGGAMGTAYISKFVAVGCGLLTPG